MSPGESRARDLARLRRLAATLAEAEREFVGPMAIGAGAHDDLVDSLQVAEAAVHRAIAELSRKQDDQDLHDPE